MLSQDDFNYALENTKVILPPKRTLETFGTSVVNYSLITEVMDSVNECIVREGQIHAERPQIVSPHQFASLLVEGFGEKAERFAEYINAHAKHIAVLKYGFKIRKSDIRRYEVFDRMDAVIEKVRKEVEGKSDPLSTVLTGVDEGWEVCLLKFMMDVIQSSSSDHIDDFRKNGFL